MWTSLYGQSMAPATPDERRQLRRIRRRRAAVLVVLLAVLPVVALASVLGFDITIAGEVGLASFASAVAWYSLSVCPRCGRSFNRRWYRSSLFNIKCVHCDFPLSPPD